MLDTGDKGVRDRHSPHPRVADMLVRDTDSTTDTQDHFRHGGVPGKIIKEEGYGYIRGGGQERLLSGGTWKQSLQ